MTTEELKKLHDKILENLHDLLDQKPSPDLYPDLGDYHKNKAIAVNYHVNTLLSLQNHTS